MKKRHVTSRWLKSLDDLPKDNGRWSTQHGVGDEAGGAAVRDGAHGGRRAPRALLRHVPYECHDLLPPPLQLCAHSTQPLTQNNY